MWLDRLAESNPGHPETLAGPGPPGITFVVSAFPVRAAPRGARVRAPPAFLGRGEERRRAAAGIGRRRQAA